MPISRNRFEELERDSEDDSTSNTNAAMVLSFLRKNPDKAFTQSEIVEETAVKTGSIGPTLVRLRERGRVDHRARYWRVSDHDQSVDVATEQAAETVTGHEDEGETPRMEAWQEHAVDPRDDR